MGAKPLFSKSSPFPPPPPEWIQSQGDGCVKVVVAASREPVCSVEGGNQVTDAANAKIIATAPGLIRALIGCLEHLEWSGDEGLEAYAEALYQLDQAGVPRW